MARLVLGLIGVYLILRDKATTGEATPLAWIASVVALFGITVGTLYQKRFGGKFDGGRQCASNMPRRRYLFMTGGGAV